MRLKRYSEFESLNESFQGSDEFEKFLKENSLNSSFFLDNLVYVEDIDNVKVNLHKFICDKQGNLLMKYDDSVDYFIRYSIVIDYSISTDDAKIDSFFNKIDGFNDIKMAIDELKNRVSDDVDFVWERVGCNPTSTARAITIPKFTFEFSLQFDSKEKINSKLKPYYDNFYKQIGPNYENMMKELRSFYHTFDVVFDDYVDVVDTDNYISVGLFIDGDLYHVADYSKSTDKYDIYHDALEDSIGGFQNDNIWR